MIDQSMGITVFDPWW